MAAATEELDTVKRALRRNLDFFEDVEGTDSQVETGIRCYRRPNRTEKRTWTPKAVARVYCDCIENGHTRTQIEREIRLKCGIQETECDCDRVRVILRQVLTAFAVATALIALLTPLRQALPFVLVTIIVRLLPLAVRRLLPGIVTGVRQLPRASRTIEGTAVRVRDELTLIEQAFSRSAALRIRVSRP